MFLLQNLNKFTDIPLVLQERIFKKVFAIAEVSNLSEEDMRTYESSLKDKRDWKNAIDTATEEGKEKGKKERSIEIARQMKREKMPVNLISKITGLTIEEIEKL